MVLYKSYSKSYIRPFFVPLSVTLQHQTTTGKRVKRWTVGQSHFPGLCGGTLV